MDFIHIVSPDTWEFAFRIFVAALLGGLVGYERDRHGRSAGLRTHLLVSMGSGVFMVISQWVAGQGAGSMGAGWPADPGRIAAQIVTGIGFIGAGVIIKEGVNVRGLTTSACLWIAAGIGMAAGSGMYGVAIFTTAMALFGLIVLKWFERFYRKDSYRILTIVTSLRYDSSTIISSVKECKINVISCDIKKDYDLKHTVTRLMVRLYSKELTDKLAHGIIEALETSKIELKSVEWSRY